MKILSMLVTCLVLAIVSSAQQASPDQHSAPAVGQDSQPSSLASAANKGDKTVSGCLKSKDGKFLIEDKQHKTIWLTGPEDLGSHVGHSVTIHGNFIPSTEKTPARQGSDFQVKQIETVADRCAPSRTNK